MFSSFINIELLCFIDHPCFTSLGNRVFWKGLHLEVQARQQKILLLDAGQLCVKLYFFKSCNAFDIQWLISIVALLFQEPNADRDSQISIQVNAYINRPLGMPLNARSLST